MQSACAIARHRRRYADWLLKGDSDPTYTIRRCPLRKRSTWLVRCEAAALALDPRIRQPEGGSVATPTAGLVMYGNSRRVLRRLSDTRHSLSCSVIAQDAEGMQRNHWHTVARDRA